MSNNETEEAVYFTKNATTLEQLPFKSTQMSEYYFS
jgi:hypothetical protein